MPAPTFESLLKKRTPRLDAARKKLTSVPPTTGDAKYLTTLDL
jgi:hypothetical protein